VQLPRQQKRKDAQPKALRRKRFHIALCGRLGLRESSMLALGFPGIGNI
jgi:hypothetical protein